MVLGKVVDKIGHTVRSTMHNAHDIASHTRWVFIECFLEKILCQSHHVTRLEVADLVPIQVQDLPTPIGVHFPAHKASQAHVSKLQGRWHSWDEGPCADHHGWRTKRSRRRSRVAAAVPLLFALDANIALRRTLALAPAACASTTAIGALHRRKREQGRRRRGQRD